MYGVGLLIMILITAEISLRFNFYSLGKFCGLFKYQRILYGTILRSGTPLILFLMVTYPVQLIKIVCLHAKIPVQDGGATEGLCLNPSG